MMNFVTNLADRALSYLLNVSDSDVDLEAAYGRSKRRRTSSSGSFLDGLQAAVPRIDLSQEPEDTFSPRTTQVDPTPQPVPSPKIRTDQFLQAASTGNLADLAAGLKQGLDPNVTDEQGRTPLMRAAAAGQEAVVDFLIDPDNRLLLFQDPEERDQYYHRVILNGGDREGHNIIMLAAQHGHSNIVKKLLNAVMEGGEQLREQNERGETALMLAAANGHARCVKKILGYELRQTRKDEYYESSIDIRDANGKSPMRRALDGQHNTCAWLIQEYRKALEDAR